MYQSFIKECLLAKRPKVYSIIIANYYTEIEQLGTTLFKQWLAAQLDIAENEINTSSLNSALNRHRKSLKKTVNSKNSDTLNNGREKEVFVFSKPVATSTINNNTEL